MLHIDNVGTDVVFAVLVKRFLDSSSGIVDDARTLIDSDSEFYTCEP